MGETESNVRLTLQHQPYELSPTHPVVSLPETTKANFRQLTAGHALLGMAAAAAGTTANAAALVLSWALAIVISSRLLKYWLPRGWRATLREYVAAEAAFHGWPGGTKGRRIRRQARARLLASVAARTTEVDQFIAQVGFALVGIAGWLVADSAIALVVGAIGGGVLPPIMRRLDKRNSAEDHQPSPSPVPGE